MKRFFKYVLVGVGLLISIQIVFFVCAITSPQWEYARRALTCNEANYDLRYCVDLPKESRKDFTHTTWKPLPCINTATSLYNYEHRAGNCNKFMANPEIWGFREVNEKDAVPGDLMLFIRKKDGARHAGVYTMNSIVGPLCANTTVKGVFMHYLPVKPFLAAKVGGFYNVKYYRYKN